MRIIIAVSYVTSMYTHAHPSVWRFADTIPVRPLSTSRHLRQPARLHKSGSYSCPTTCACMLSLARLLRANCACNMPTHPGALAQWDCSVSCEVRLKAAAGGGITGSCVDDEGELHCCQEMAEVPSRLVPPTGSAAQYTNRPAAIPLPVWSWLWQGQPSQLYLILQRSECASWAAALSTAAMVPVPSQSMPSMLRRALSLRA